MSKSQWFQGTHSTKARSHSDNAIAFPRKLEEAIAFPRKSGKKTIALIDKSDWGRTHLEHRQSILVTGGEISPRVTHRIDNGHGAFPM